MKQWLSNHWDKLALGVLAAIVAGVSGFFSSLAMLQGEMAGMRERIASVETKLDSAVVPKLSTIDSNDDRIRAAETEIILLKNQNYFARQLATPTTQRRDRKRSLIISDTPWPAHKESQP